MSIKYIPGFHIDWKEKDVDVPRILFQVTTPFDELGFTARHVIDAAYELAEVIGKATSKRWKERFRAAGFYWDITDCEDACIRLTGGTDKKGFGISASFGRLLCHYPVELMRDSIFLARAGLEAESANGHVYVESFFCFAEYAHKAGFTIAIYPSVLQPMFRQHFGIYGFEESPPPEY